MKVIITGATGFVGSHLLEFFSKIGVDVIIISDSSKDFRSFSYNAFFNNEVCNSEVDVFIHLAGAAHRVYTDEEAENINFNLTRKIVDKCIELKIPKIIFLSSVNIYEEQHNTIDLSTKVANNLTNTAYTKLLAEDYIKLKSSGNYIKSVIIRCPIIYGEGVKANFALLIRLVCRGFPLPLRSIKNNKRSLVSVYNLIDLINVCIKNHNSVNQTFLVSDDNDLSTSEIVSLIAKVKSKKNFSLPVPVWCLKLAGKILNKSDIVNRLTGSLQLDITYTKNTLNWTPPYSIEHGFKLASKSLYNKN